MRVKVRTWRGPIKPLYFGDVRTFHHKDDMGGTRGVVSANDEGAATQLAAAVQYLPHGPRRRRPRNGWPTRAGADAPGLGAAVVVEATE
jgi:hypothetical protein